MYYKALRPLPQTAQHGVVTDCANNHKPSVKT